MRLGTKQDAEAAEALAQTIGERVQSIRVSRQLTQATLAERLSCTVEAVSRLERGRAVPSLGRLARIAAALEVPIQDLFVAQQAQQQSDAGARFEQLWARSSSGFQNALGALVQSLDEAHGAATTSEERHDVPTPRQRVRAEQPKKWTVDSIRDQFRKTKKKGRRSKRSKKS